MRFFHDTNIDFVGKRKIFFIVSIIVILSGILATFVLGVEYGIDFEGGTEVAVKFDQNVDTEQIRQAINNAGLTGSEIKSYGKEKQYLIRVKESEDAAKEVVAALQTAFPGMDIETIKSDTIGPKIGSEMKGQAILAVLLSVIAILIYIAFRFEFTFGLGAIIALMHDVLVTFSVVVIVNSISGMNLELNLSILAGLLTVIGFSINDTVIIFDRIRENREKYKGRSFIYMVNKSINETLSRTVNTVFTAIIVLITLVFFGGPVLQGFAFTMLIGIITGTYSSIYIASSFVIWFLENVRKVDVDKTMTKSNNIGTAKA